MNGAFSPYYDQQAISAAVERGEHRDVIGGIWDVMGRLQIEFLQTHGLRPASSLLDIGCGSLRLGVHAIKYLDAGKYWGTDLNAVLLDAGYDKEIVPAGLASKLPRSQLVLDAEFTFQGVTNAIDFAIATSVFTHLPFNHMRLCLANLGRHVTGPCTFFFTIFEPGCDFTRPHRHERGGIVTHAHRDPYHYLTADLHYAAAGTPWTIEFIGDWKHPRNQMMVKAQKT